MTIEFTASGGHLDPARIAALEGTLRVKLPEDYREFLLQYNSALPEGNVYREDKAITAGEYLFGISPDRGHDLVVQNREVYANRLPRGILAIAQASGGNLICLQMSDGSVYFWDHELEAGADEDPCYENMVKLAVSFREFLERLGIYRREDFFPNSSKVVSVKLRPGFQEKFKKYM